jgi:hypothetical protein
VRFELTGSVRFVLTGLMIIIGSVSLIGSVRFIPVIIIEPVSITGSVTFDAIWDSDFIVIRTCKSGLLLD